MTMTQAEYLVQVERIENDDRMWPDVKAWALKQLAYAAGILLKFERLGVIFEEDYFDSGVHHFNWNVRIGQHHTQARISISEAMMTMWTNYDWKYVIAKQAIAYALEMIDKSEKGETT